MNSIRVRIDHLNSPVLMARLTSLGLNMTDTWLAAVSSGACRKYTRRGTVSEEIQRSCCLGGCDVELLVNVRWEDLEILISSSTSPDLVDSVRRIRQFIHQQKMNSRRTLRDLVSGQARLPQTQPTLIPERPSDSSIQTGRPTAYFMIRLWLLLCTRNVQITLNTTTGVGWRTCRNSCVVSSVWMNGSTLAWEAYWY